MSEAQADPGSDLVHQVLGSEVNRPLGAGAQCYLDVPVINPAARDGLLPILSELAERPSSAALPSRPRDP